MDALAAAVRALLLVAAAVALAAAAGAEALSLDVHHRYSATVRTWAEAAGHPGHRAPPAAGTAEYYAALAGHDLRRRSLAVAPVPTPGAGGPLAIADGNDTYRLNDFRLQGGTMHAGVASLRESGVVRVATAV